MIAAQRQQPRDLIDAAADVQEQQARHACVPEERIDPPRRARRILLYGEAGIGKSVWAAASPRPFVFDLGGCAKAIGADCTPRLKTCGEVSARLEKIAEAPHKYRTVVLDGIDCLEDGVLGRNRFHPGNGNSSILEAAFMGGLQTIEDALEELQEELGFGVIMIANSRVLKTTILGVDCTKHSPNVGPIASRLYAPRRCQDIYFAERVVPSLCVLHTRSTSTFYARRGVALPDVLPLEFHRFADELAKRVPSPSRPILVSATGDASFDRSAW